MIFDVTGGVTKVAFTQAFEQTVSRWTRFPTNSGANDATDGEGNTDLILADFTCFDDPDFCAASWCRDVLGPNPPEHPTWYLPAIVELSQIHNAFCSNNAFPCNFGNFSALPPIYLYWSSTEVVGGGLADIVTFPDGTVSNFSQDQGLAVVCAKVVP